MGFMAWQDNSKGISGVFTTTMLTSAYIFRSGSNDDEKEEEYDEDGEDGEDDYEVSDQNAGGKFPISFTNKSNKIVYINWVHQDSPWQEDNVIGNLAPGQTETIHSHPGHWFAAYDQQRTFRVVYIANEPEKTFLIREEDVASNRAVKVKFINSSSKSTNVNWINTDTLEERTIVEHLLPGKSSGEIDSYTNHHFFAFDDEFSFRVEFEVDAGHANGDLATFTLTDALIGPPKAVFVNAMQEPVHVNWVGSDKSERQVITNLSPDHESTPLDTFHGHIFVAYDEKRTFRTEFTVVKRHGTEVFRIQGYDGVARAMTQFVNSHPSDVIHINYIDDITKEEHSVIRNLPPNESSDILTAFRGHRFVAFNEARTFRKIFTHQGPLGLVESHTVTAGEL